MSERPRCRHCQKNLICRPKGLCYGCSRNPAIRTLYAPKECKSTPKGLPDFVGSAPEPEPTEHLPATEAKMIALIERAKRGEALFAPRDARRPLQ